MAKDRTRNARRRSGDFYRARRMQSLTRNSNRFSRELRKLGVSFDCALASTSHFAEALGAWRRKALEGIESDDRRG